MMKIKDQEDQIHIHPAIPRRDSFTFSSAKRVNLLGLPPAGLLSHNDHVEVVRKIHSRTIIPLHRPTTSKTTADLVIPVTATRYRLP
jgi:hypothetical protein